MGMMQDVESSAGPTWYFAHWFAKGPAGAISVAIFFGIIAGDEAIDNGLPGDDLSQDDQIVVVIGHMSVDRLGREDILKGVCYHNRDLFAGLENV